MTKTAKQVDKEEKNKHRNTQESEIKIHGGQRPTEAKKEGNGIDFERQLRIYIIRT